MFDWETGEDSWEQGYSAGEERNRSPEKSTTSVAKKRVTVFVGVLIVAVATAAGALRWQASRGLANARADLQAAVDKEAWAQETGNRPLFESLLDPQAPDHWRQQMIRHLGPVTDDSITEVSITDFALERPDLALVELIAYRDGGSTLRETRAYRRAGGTWLRTTPPADQFWVKQQQIQTENLRFVFHRADLEQVRDIINPLQGLYTQLLNDFSLAPPAEKRTLEVALSVQPANVGLDDPRLFDVSHFEEIDSEAFKCQLGSALAGRVLMLFEGEAGNWAFLLDAIRNWELQQWSPTCEVDQSAVIVDVLEERPFIPLGLLTPERMEGTAATVLGESFVDYFVRRYGRVHLAALAVNVAHADTWPDLIEKLNLEYVELTNEWWDHVDREARRSASPGTSRPTSEPGEARRAVEWMLHLENIAIQTGDRQLFELLVDPDADEIWRRQVLREFDDIIEKKTSQWAELDSLELNENRAKVMVQIKGPAVAGVRPVFSRPERRWYRYAAGRWMRTSETQQPRSEMRQLETEYLRLQFHDSEADFVSALTESMDAFYAAIAGDFGVELETQEKVPVEISHAHIRQFRRRGSPIIVLWPGAAAEYVQTDSPLTYSRTNLAYDLGRHLLDTSTASSAGLVANLLREAILRWEVSHRIGRISWLSDTEAEIAALLESNRPLEIPAWTDPEVINALPIYVTVVDYVAESYGSERFADLIRQSAAYESLDEIVRAALGVKFADFEAGWRAHVRDKYAE